MFKLEQMYNHAGLGVIYLYVSCGHVGKFDYAKQQTEKEHMA